MLNKSRSISGRISLKDCLLSLLILLAATTVCLLLNLIDNTFSYIPLIYILAIFLISRFTNGYTCGIIASLLSVLIINLLFTYPYFKFNFTLSGYPLSIICSLAISITTSTLTTQIKRSEEIKREAELEKMRGNLLRAISHDIRTPLTSILGASSAMIENDDFIEKGQRIGFLKEIKEQSEWLIRMVENLLSVTRINSEKKSATIVKEQEAVEEIIADAVSKFKKRYPDIKLSVYIPDELLMIYMDSILIEQVISNLLENVVIHAKGFTSIKISVEIHDDCAEFTVSDDGIGISKEIIPHIFDGLGHRKSSDNARNMGIGLSVCNTIIQAHNGAMTARSNKNKGASFSFTLPISEE